jgi:hypothetical protein
VVIVGGLADCPHPELNNAITLRTAPTVRWQTALRNDIRINISPLELGLISQKSPL